MKLSKQIGIKIAGWMLLAGCGCMTQAVHAQQANRSSNVFTKESVSTNHTVEVKAVDNRIIVSNAPVNAKMEIYNIIGTKVSEMELKQPSGEYVLPLPKGYYMVRIAGTVRKIVIR